jgi:hypothetical protein
MRSQMARSTGMIKMDVGYDDCCQIFPVNPQLIKSGDHRARAFCGTCFDQAGFRAPDQVPSRNP